MKHTRADMARQRMARRWFVVEVMLTIIGFLLTGSYLRNVLWASESEVSEQAKQVWAASLSATVVVFGLLGSVSTCMRFRWPVLAKDYWLRSRYYLMMGFQFAVLVVTIIAILDM